MNLIPAFTICLTLFLQAADPPALVSTIEQQRGGRHWIDQPTEPPRSPAESASLLAIEPGYRISLVAAEPLVVDPVAIDFDQQGRMFVVEYCDYPVGPVDGSKRALSRIVMLTDEDGDHSWDKRTVFAEELRFCHSLLCLPHGILACTESAIVFLPDQNNDGMADAVETWFEGFTPAHPQMQIGCPRIGLDNWIYLTYGQGNVRCVRPGFETAEPVTIPRVDFRFHPQTMQFEAVAGAGQFGNTIDCYGHRFFSSNRNPIMTDLYTLQQVAANPLAGVRTGHINVGPFGEQTRVYPRVAMKSNWLAHAGTHTSACGVTACRSPLFGADSLSSVFVCEPVGHLVTRSVVQPDGAGLTAVRARAEADFLTSTDTWFRPASLTTGPDGAIYLADMYRLWVEHPKFVPDDVAARMDWRAGEDLGRIWRITPQGSPHHIPFTSPQSPADAVQLLKSSNGWQRTLGQALLVYGEHQQLADSIRAILHGFTEGHYSGLSRLHAMWTLHGLGQLSAADLQAAATDTFAPLRRDAARLLAAAQPVDKSALLQLATDTDAEVRLRAVSELQGSTSLLTPAQLAYAVTADPYLQQAWLMHHPNAAAAVLNAVVSALLEQDAPAVADYSEYTRLLALNAAANADESQFQVLLSQLSRGSDQLTWWKAAVVAGITSGLPRRSDKLIPASLTALLESPPDRLRSGVAELQQVISNAATLAVDRTARTEDRVAAVSLLQGAAADLQSEVIQALLVAGEFSDCQTAAVEIARNSREVSLKLQVLASWDLLAPAARTAAVSMLLANPETLSATLEAMAAGLISPAVVTVDQRLLLLKHPQPELRAAAEQLFGGAVSANRQQVATVYQAALEHQGNADSGAVIFRKVCSRCHRIGGEGHNVGPDISDTRARAADALLYDILDPNRRVDPQYSEYVVVTTEGLLLNGLLVAETDTEITLRQPEGRQQTLARDQIEEMRVTGKSLMPEGLEKDVTVEQMADIIAFLRSAEPGRVD